MSRNYFADIERWLPRNVDPDLLRWVQQQKRSHSILQFSANGIDPDTGASLWLVGSESEPHEFAAQCAGVATLHAIVSAGPAGLDTATIVPPGATSGAAAVRRAVDRGRAEIEKHCPQLAQELHKIVVGHRAVRYEPTAGSPVLKTNANAKRTRQIDSLGLASSHDQSPRN